MAMYAIQLQILPQKVYFKVFDPYKDLIFPTLDIHHVFNTLILI